MSDWYTPAELAGLPGLPTTDRRVRATAAREGWQSRKKPRGKGFQYPLSALPDTTQAYLRSQAAQAVTTDPKDLPAPVSTRAVAELSDRERAQMHARLIVLAVVDEIAARLGSKSQAIAEFLHLVDCGQVAEAVLDALHTAKNGRKGARLINRATLYRWISAREAGNTALAVRNGRRGAHHPWEHQLLAAYQDPNKPTVAAIVRDWGRIYPDTPAPPLRAAQAVIKKIPAEIKNYRRMGTHARRAVQPFVRRTTDGLWPMDIVTVDGHLFKAYVRHPITGRRFRPEVTVYLDIATRKAVGFSAWIAESQFCIWNALHDMVSNPGVGIPAMHYSDNGAYRGEQHRATLARLGTTTMFSQAYRAQARGVIERFNSSVWVPLARQLPTYAGQDVDAEAFRRRLKKADADGEGLPGWEDFVSGCRAALAEYNNRKHAHLKGMTPAEKWQQAVDDGWQPTTLQNDDLHDLLHHVERKVCRGEVNLPWGRYFSKPLSLHHGETVRVHYLPTDGARVWIADQSGALIGTAKRDGNARPYVHASQLDHARAQREKGRADRLERKLAAVREEGATQIEAQPADPALAALAERNLATLRAEFEAAPAFAVPDNDPDRYQLWKEFEQNPDLSPEQAAFFDRFRDAPYCRHMREMEAEFEKALNQ